MKQSFKKGFGVTLGVLTANLLFTIAAKLASEKLRNSSLEGEAKPEEESFIRTLFLLYFEIL